MKQFTRVVGAMVLAAGGWFVFRWWMGRGSWDHTLSRTLSEPVEVRDVGDFLTIYDEESLTIYGDRAYWVEGASALSSDDLAALAVDLENDSARHIWRKYKGSSEPPVWTLDAQMVTDARECPHCEYVGAGKNIAIHINTNHPDQLPTCDKCGKGIDVAMLTRIESTCAVPAQIVCRDSILCDDTVWNKLSNETNAR